MTAQKKPVRRSKRGKLHKLAGVLFRRKAAEPKAVPHPPRRVGPGRVDEDVQ